MKKKNEFFGPTPAQMGYKKDEGPDEFGTPLKEDASGRPIKEAEPEAREWGTPLTESEMTEIGFKVGDKVKIHPSEGGVGTILDIKKYDIDGVTIMAEIERPDKTKVMFNVRGMSKAEDKSS